jgi:hypothetical protein
MSNAGSVTEASGVLDGGIEKIREADVAVEAVADFLERMINDLGGMGLPVEAKMAAKEAADELRAECDGLIHAFEELQTRILALGDNTAG